MGICGEMEVVFVGRQSNRKRVFQKIFLSLFATQSQARHTAVLVWHSAAWPQDRGIRVTLDALANITPPFIQPHISLVLTIYWVP